ncbi:hypothetical protein H5410_061419 [Solanum commersonii]|uniref:Uncharacterized protein n=1 Tax=Solanum commersonii TaxID=4109 RepID=A0A9J5W7R8_SOLCO|nr:hypothetical protein H5410_061419 [Solanum commersonii]
MPTIPKNSIDLEKENKQTNPSAHASTNLEVVQSNFAFQIKHTRSDRPEKKLLLMFLDNSR